MKPSEIILSKVASTTYLYDKQVAKILDEMAEDIKYLKSQVNNPFPFMTPPPKEREWET